MPDPTPRCPVPDPLTRQANLDRLRHMADFLDDHGIGVGDHPDGPFLREVAAERARLAAENAGLTHLIRLRCGYILGTCRGEDEMRAEARAMLAAVEDTP